MDLSSAQVFVNHGFFSYVVFSGTLSSRSAWIRNPGTTATDSILSLGLPRLHAARSSIFDRRTAFRFQLSCQKEFFVCKASAAFLGGQACLAANYFISVISPFPICVMVRDVNAGIHPEMEMDVLKAASRPRHQGVVEFVLPYWRKGLRL